MKIVLHFLAITLTRYGIGQTDSIPIHFKWGSKEIHLNTFYPTDVEGETVVFTKIQLYVCPIQTHDPTPENYRLIDLSDISSTMLPFERSFEKQVLLFGVDSILHQKGVFEGSLDPVHGMYWAWQSGYINLKIQGITNITVVFV